MIPSARLGDTVLNRVYISSGMSCEQMMNDRGLFFRVLLLTKRYRYSTSLCSAVVSRKSSMMIRLVLATLFKNFTYLPFSSASRASLPLPYVTTCGRSAENLQQCSQALFPNAQAKKVLPHPVAEDISIFKLCEI